MIISNTDSAYYNFTAGTFSNTSTTGNLNLVTRSFSAPNAINVSSSNGSSSAYLFGLVENTDCPQRFKTTASSAVYTTHYTSDVSFPATTMHSSDTYSNFITTRSATSGTTTYRTTSTNTTTNDYAYLGTTYSSSNSAATFYSSNNVNCDYTGTQLVGLSKTVRVQRYATAYSIPATVYTIGGLVSASAIFRCTRMSNLAKMATLTASITNGTHRQLDYNTSSFTSQLTNTLSYMNAWVKPLSSATTTIVVTNTIFSSILDTLYSFGLEDKNTQYTDTSTYTVNYTSTGVSSLTVNYSAGTATQRPNVIASSSLASYHIYNPIEKVINNASGITLTDITASCSNSRSSITYSLDYNQLSNITATSTSGYGSNVISQNTIASNYIILSASKYAIGYTSSKFSTDTCFTSSTTSLTGYSAVLATCTARYTISQTCSNTWRAIGVITVPGVMTTTNVQHYFGFPAISSETYCQTLALYNTHANSVSSYGSKTSSVSRTSISQIFRYSSSATTYTTSNATLSITRNVTTDLISETEAPANIYYEQTY